MTARRLTKEGIELLKDWILICEEEDAMREHKRTQDPTIRGSIALEKPGGAGKKIMSQGGL